MLIRPVIKRKVVVVISFSYHFMKLFLYSGSTSRSLIVFLSFCMLLVLSSCDCNCTLMRTFRFVPPINFFCLFPKIFFIFTHDPLKLFLSYFFVFHILSTLALCNYSLPGNKTCSRLVDFSMASLPLHSWLCLCKVPNINNSNWQIPQTLFSSFHYSLWLAHGIFWLRDCTKTHICFLEKGACDLPFRMEPLRESSALLSVPSKAPPSFKKTQYFCRSLCLNRCAFFSNLLK